MGQHVNFLRSEPRRLVGDLAGGVRRAAVPGPEGDHAAAAVRELLPGHVVPRQAAVRVRPGPRVLLRDVHVARRGGARERLVRNGQDAHHGRLPRALRSQIRYSSEWIPVLCL